MGLLYLYLGNSSKIQNFGNEAAYTGIFFFWVVRATVSF